MRGVWAPSPVRYDGSSGFRNFLEGSSTFEMIPSYFLKLLIGQNPGDVFTKVAGGSLGAVSIYLGDGSGEHQGELPYKSPCVVFAG